MYRYKLDDVAESGVKESAGDSRRLRIYRMRRSLGLVIRAEKPHEKSDILVSLGNKRVHTREFKDRSAGNPTGTGGKMKIQIEEISPRSYKKCFLREERFRDSPRSKLEKLLKRGNQQIDTSLDPSELQRAIHRVMTPERIDSQSITSPTKTQDTRVLKKSFPTKTPKNKKPAKVEDLKHRPKLNPILSLPKLADSSEMRGNRPVSLGLSSSYGIISKQDIGKLNRSGNFDGQQPRKYRQKDDFHKVRREERDLRQKQRIDEARTKDPLNWSLESEEELHEDDIANDPFTHSTKTKKRSVNLQKLLGNKRVSSTKIQRSKIGILNDSSSSSDGENNNDQQDKAALFKPLRGLRLVNHILGHQAREGKSYKMQDLRTREVAYRAGLPPRGKRLKIKKHILPHCCV
eukprot:CAMPEP_0114991570 /NCGR_PEP_ID=MMETSP0216-20121206/11448_1 /TAXON_ID=223996 /ORGANISM="Protocruzia adherens, Strain Boccale" /LENGTH=403 /DNA_ID=CAMNT_0002354917 /DNA_START=145 /DNA_END=1356 /DNA_ORIENTATION=-